MLRARVPVRKGLILLIVPLFLWTAPGCQKAEEEPSVVVKKEEAPLPELSQERIDLWFTLAAEISRYIRKFSLDDEDVRDKRDLMMLAHSSSRSQYAYSEIFKEAGMSTAEFWSILDEMQDVEKYTKIKNEEAAQNTQLDALIESGEKELTILKKQQQSDNLIKTIADMEVKLDEFRSLRGNVSPESVGVSEMAISLWKANKDKIDEALFAMWKISKHAGMKN